MSGSISSKLLSFPVTVILFLVALLWSADRPNLTGSWQLNPSKCDPHFTKFSELTWVIDQKDGWIHVSGDRTASRWQRHQDGFLLHDGREGMPLSARDQPGKVSVLVQRPGCWWKWNSVGRNREYRCQKEDETFRRWQADACRSHSPRRREQAGKLVFEKQ